jgi:hypothetical protein
MAARNILRHAVTWPVIGPAAGFLWDTLDWLNPYWTFDENEFQQDYHHGGRDDLSPRL